MTDQTRNQAAAAAEAEVQDTAAGKALTAARTASVARKTNETNIELAFNVDGTGGSEIGTAV